MFYGHNTKDAVLAKIPPPFLVTCDIARVRRIACMHAAVPMSGAGAFLIINNPLSIALSTTLYLDISLLFRYLKSSGFSDNSVTIVERKTLLLTRRDREVLTFSKVQTLPFEIQGDKRRGQISLLCILL